MTSLPLSNLKLLFSTIITTVVLSACGGGGGGTDAGGGFTTSNTNTKPQASSESSAESKTSSSKSSSSAAKSSTSSSSSQSGRDTTAPTMADELKLTLNQYDIVGISWKAATDNVEVVSYKIYRNQIQIDQLEAIDTTYLDFSVASDSTYTYAVSAGDTAGNWSALKTVVAQTPPTPAPSATSSSSSSAGSLSSSSIAGNKSSSSTSSQPSSSRSSSSSNSSADNIAPSAPASVFQISTSINKVDIGWSAATDNVKVTKYQVYRDNVLIGSTAASTLQFSDPTVTPDKQYNYTVKAGDDAGNWSTGKSAMITTPSVLANGDARLYWQAPTAREDGSTLGIQDIKGYLLRYKALGDTNFTFIDLLGNTTTTYTIRNLTGNFQFEIASYDLNYVQSNFIPLPPK